MKIIDQEGRILGKINIVDFIALLLIVSVVPLSYMGYRILNKPAAIQREYEIQNVNTAQLPKLTSEYVEVYCVFENIPASLAKMIKVGDKEITIESQVIGEILELGTFTPMSYEIKLSVNNIIRKEDPNKFAVIAKMRLRCYISNNVASYKEDAVRINSKIDFHTSGYKLSGRILSGYPISLNYVKVYVLFKDVDQETLDKIKIGDIIIGPDNTPIGIITDLGIIEPDEKTEIVNGSIVTKKDPVRKQVFARIKVRGHSAGEEIYDFDGYRFSDFRKIEVKTQNYRLNAIVINTIQ